MADILQDFPIQASPSLVFAAVSEPALLDEWWILRSTGRPAVGTTYELDFGPRYQWRAVVEKSAPGVRILRRHLEHGESVPYDTRFDV
jgi:uncharacterized protein YndB with AHSA1/START domain